MTIQSGLRIVSGALAVAVLAAAAARGARASEAKGDLNLSLRLVEIIPGKSVAGSPPNGIARIEVIVDAFEATQQLELTVERADGSPWTVKGRPVTPRPSPYTTPGGEPWEPGADGITVPSRGTLRTMIEVPLEGAAVHEIILRATGLAAGSLVTTEAMVLAALGAPLNLPVDDGTVANFGLQGVK